MSNNSITCVDTTSSMILTVARQSKKTLVILVA